MGDIFMNKYEALKKYFGYDSFRGSQEMVIDSLLKDYDTIAILRTGGGKSVCFQIPSLLRDGLTIVVTPLISLMYDQVRELKDRGIKAEFINSSMKNKEQREIYKSLSELKILYVAPERLLNKEFIEYVKRIKVSYLIVDEAHTIMWHMDFRESFLSIKDFLSEFGYKIPLGLFSATANKYTIDEIKRVCGINNPNIIKSSFDRPDLFYRVVRNKNKIEYINWYLKGHNECGIIYCNTRKEVMALYEVLKNNYRVYYYHAGLDNKVKEENQNRFIKSKAGVMIATNAFGMGINKPDIRFVINYDMPDSVESLSQMVGRASRDGKGGECVILYNNVDIRTIYFFIQQIDSSSKSLKEISKVKSYKYFCMQSIKKILTSGECIHKSMARYFGESIPCCNNMCSNCQNS